MRSISISQARQELSQIVHRATSLGERIVLRLRDKDVAAIVPVEDLKLIEAMEDRLDIEAAHDALEESDERIPYHTVRRKLIENVRHRTHTRGSARSSKPSKRSTRARGRQDSIAR